MSQVKHYLWISLFTLGFCMVKMDIHITGDTGYVERNSLRLNCSAREKCVELEWILSVTSQAEEENRVLKHCEDSHNNTYFSITIINLTLSDSGVFMCISKPKLKHRATATVRVFGLDEYPSAPEILQIQENSTSEHMTFKCLTDQQHYFTMDWIPPTSAIHENQLNVTRISAMGQLLGVRRYGNRDNGRYTCMITNLVNRRTSTKVLDVNNISEFPPFFSKCFFADVEELEVDLNQQLTIQCFVIGNSTISVHWIFNGLPIQPDMINPVQLTINRVSKDDLGRYECQAENHQGRALKKIFVKIRTHRFKITLSFILCIIMIMVITTIALILFKCYRKERNKRSALERSGISYFIEGNASGIKEEISIVDQADLLPYDVSYDFSKKDLKLGTLLGSGAFGEVIKGEATGMVATEPFTTVAVKRVKNPSNSEDIKSLIAELKIMIFIGKHVNVLNLLGVVRENLNQRELLVITEFCEFGNLREYLRSNRAHFINEIRSTNGDLESTQTEQSDGETYYDNPEHVEKPSSESAQGHIIRTTDLVCWSYQVTQGMNYLATKGILHGDLAARNILLTSNNCVRISDFGFSRRLRVDENYTKGNDAALPLKWMAIESLADKIFNSSTDVWSFGVMMWELFSLGTVPYQSIPTFDLLQQLSCGYRLAKPDFAPAGIYTIMQDCWETQSLDRPRFRTIGERLMKWLPSAMVQEFQDRNAEYAQMNADMKSKFDFMTTLPDTRAPIGTGESSRVSSFCNVAETTV